MSRKTTTKKQPAKRAAAKIQYTPQAQRQAVTVPQRLLEDRRREESTLIGALVTAASNPATDVDKMERLWMIHKEAIAARAEQEFALAKNALALEIPAIPKSHKIEFKDKNGTIQSTPYANREDIERIIGPIYRRHGFSTEYSTEYVDNKIQTILIVRHNSGHKEIYKSAPMPLDTTGSKNNNQAAGSTSEYGMRYCLKGAFNIIGIDTDDDGSHAGDGSRGGKTPSKFDQRAEAALNPNDRKTVDAQASRVDDNANGDYSPELAEIGDEDEWDRRTIITSPGKKVVKDFEDDFQAISYLRSVMSKHNSKASRLQLINLNTAITRYLIRGNNMPVLNALHALADAGTGEAA